MNDWCAGGATYPGGDLSINPVLVLGVLRTAELRQLGHKGGEVEEGGHSREPELLYTAVYDNKFDPPQRTMQLKVSWTFSMSQLMVNCNHHKEPVFCSLAHHKEPLESKFDSQQTIMLK